MRAVEIIETRMAATYCHAPPARCSPAAYLAHLQRELARPVFGPAGARMGRRVTSKAAAVMAAA